MSDNIIFLSSFTDPRFCAAFQVYFAELGISVSDWDGLFREINEEGNNRAFLMVDDSDESIGFLMFQLNAFTNWFFEEQFGFIREFWIAPDFRKKGCGSELLRRTEQYFAEHAVYRVLLTADNAIDFYLARGYQKFPGITAKNKMEVLAKTLNCCPNA